MPVTPTFRRLITEIHEQQVVVPIIRAALSEPSFDGFEVPVEGWTPKPFDGWWHPSTHSTWTARQLAYYLLHGDELPVERPELLFVLSVTQGKFWHEFIQRLLLENGLMIKKEVPLKDREHRRKGHTDGLLLKDELFEFKTASERQIKKMTDVEALKEQKPEYYAQTQDYLDMAGADKMRYFVMMLSAPFIMQEFIVPADPPFQAAQRAKYREALDCIENNLLPSPCCAIGSTESRACPMRTFCPVGASS